MSFDCLFFFFSSRRRHTRWPRDWSSDVCSSDLVQPQVSALMPERFSSRGLNAQVEQYLSPALKPIKVLQQMNDPRGIYARFMECAAPSHCLRVAASTCGAKVWRHTQSPLT